MAARTMDGLQALTSSAIKALRLWERDMAHHERPSSLDEAMARGTIQGHIFSRAHTHTHARAHTHTYIHTHTHTHALYSTRMSTRACWKSRVSVGRHCVIILDHWPHTSRHALWSPSQVASCFHMLWHHAWAYSSWRNADGWFSLLDWCLFDVYVHLTG